MRWTRIDVAIFRNPKVLECSNDAKLVYIASICYSAEHGTDGLIKRKAAALILATVGAGWDVVGELTDAGLWEQDGDTFHVHDFLEYQPSAGEMQEREERISRVRSEAGKRGAAARWHGKDGKDDDKGHDKSHDKAIAKNGYDTIRDDTTRDGTSTAAAGAVTRAPADDGAAGEVPDAVAVACLFEPEPAPVTVSFYTGVARQHPRLDPMLEAVACRDFYTDKGRFGNGPPGPWTKLFKNWCEDSERRLDQQARIVQKTAAPVPLNWASRGQARADMTVEGEEDVAARKRFAAHVEKLQERERQGGGGA